MNHKRKRVRNRRAGCKLCKPWKANGVRTESIQGRALQRSQAPDRAGGAGRHGMTSAAWLRAFV